MTRQAPASGLVLHKYDHTAYRVFDRATGQQLGYVVAWWERWTAETVTRLILAEGRTRSAALHAAWPEKYPTRPAQPPSPVGGQSGEGDGPNGPQNDAEDFAGQHEGHDVGWRHKDGRLYSATCHDCGATYRDVQADQ